MAAVNSENLINYEELNNQPDQLVHHFINALRPVYPSCQSNKRYDIKTFAKLDEYYTKPIELCRNIKKILSLELPKISDGFQLNNEWCRKFNFPTFYPEFFDFNTGKWADNSETIKYETEGFINKLKKSKFNPMIFGGFVRDLIAKRQYKDIDIYIDCDINVSRNYYIKIIQFLIDCLKKIYKNVSIKLLNESKEGEWFDHFLNKEHVIYNLLKLQVDDMNIDLVMSINYVCVFDTMPDYTMNNLVLHVDETINLRTPTKYSVEESIEHIKTKQLIFGNSVTKFYVLDKLYDISVPPKHRTEKMQSWIEFNSEAKYQTIQN